MKAQNWFVHWHLCAIAYKLLLIYNDFILHYMKLYPTQKKNIILHFQQIKFMTMYINHIPLFYRNIINIYLYYPILYHYYSVSSKETKIHFDNKKKIIINSLSTKKKTQQIKKKIAGDNTTFDLCRFTSGIPERVTNWFFFWIHVEYMWLHDGFIYS